MLAGVSALLLVAGCGAAPTAPSLAGLSFAAPASALPVQVTDSTGTATTVESTERILAVNGDLVEVVFALGLGGSLVARDLSATYPPQVQELPVVGYQRALSPEPIAAFEPTLVLANSLAGPPGAVEQLRRVAPTVVLHYPETLDGPPAKIRAVARVLGVPGRGEELARTVEQEIAAATAIAAGSVERPRVAVLYVRGEGVQVLLGRGTAELVEAAGGVAVARELGITDSAAVDPETLIAAAPDVLVVTTSGLESVGGVDGLLELAGGAFARTPAGERRRVLAFEDQYLLGFGPRTGALLTDHVNQCQEK